MYRARDQNLSLWQAAESHLELVQAKFQAERKRYEDQALNHEQQLFEVALRLKETKNQTELLHNQVTFLTKFLEWKRAELDNIEQTAENVEAGKIAQDDNAEVNQLCATVDDFRKIASMRSDNALLDALVGVLHEAIQAELSTCILPALSFCFEVEKASVHGRV
jgi:hypothetical protein